MLLDVDGSARLPAGWLDVRIQVAPGEVVALVGPNGAGKSTTLEVVAGLRSLVDGRLLLRGEQVDDGRRADPPHTRGLGWAPQEAALLPRRRPRRQVARFARTGQDPRSWLERVGIEPDDRRRPTALSVGERQRVSVARALAAGDLVLLDEPTSAQDIDGAVRIRTAIRDHAADGGGSVIVSHRAEEAYRLADRIVVVERDGDRTRVVQTGTPDELAAAPASPYVASSVGATVLRGEVGRDRVLRGSWGELRVRDGTPRGAALAIVRPTAVAVHAAPPSGSSPRNVLRGVVSSVHDRRDGVTVTVAARPDLVATLTHAAAAELGLTSGREVWVSVKATEIEVTPVGGAPDATRGRGPTS